ncbi:PA14 domain-containing protein [Cerasicoccus frondis]|uniref:PA14 domain-containing protein n=1 Tax=Cerasicoccus frondis TaxID=490090 RepID=UPI0028525B48|nr:PA14 domain-containing protein [Cerasicoccus frondis]
MSFLGAAAVKAASFAAVEKDTIGNRHGYYEYLPTAYHENPTENFPVVMFFHGLGETGDGYLAEEGEGTSGHLQRVLGHGPPRIVKDGSTHKFRDLFDENDVMVLAPQHTTWWNAREIRLFLDFAVETYRIDPRRIYVTGLSAGCAGIQDFINNDADSDQVTAYVVCAMRGKVETGLGDYLGTRSPYWALTAVNASANERGLAEDSATNLASYLMGSTAPNIRTGYPGTSTVNTVYFDAVAENWVWQSGVPENLDRNIKVTLYTGSDHNSYTRTYDEASVYAWMFAQQKPTIVIDSPVTEEDLVPLGTELTFTGTAEDADGVAIDANTLEWHSDIDGLLGVGPSITTAGLTVGAHVISAATTDSYYRYGQGVTTVNVINSGSYTIEVDFGYSTATTPDWNNIYDEDAGDTNSYVENAINTDGDPTGVRVEISDSFYGAQAGVATDTLYPTTVQQDAFYVREGDDYGAVLISGLNPDQTYDFTLFASRSSSGVRRALYTIHGQTATLEAAYNTDQVAVIDGVSPNASGEILVEVERDNHTGLAYLGAMVMTANVEIPNAAPVVDAGTNASVPLESDSTAVIDLFGEITDDGQSASLTIAWTVLDQPAGANAIIADASSPVTTLSVDQPGAYTLQLSADDEEFTITDTVVLTAFYPPLPYQTIWRNYFPPEIRNQAALASGDADADQDGIANLVEIALGTDPTQSSQRNFSLCLEGYESGLIFPRDPSLIDMTYTVWRSTTLEAGSWTALAQSVNGGAMVSLVGDAVMIAETGHDPIEVTVCEEGLTADTGPRFYRLSFDSSTDLFSNGVAYQLFSGSFASLPDFNALSPVESGVKSDFSLTNDAGLTADFALRFEASLLVETAGDYTFYTDSSDGSRLWVDDAVVVANDGVHGAQEVSGVATLSAGYHQLVVEFFDAGGGASLTVSYEGPGVAKQAIPSSVLLTPSE